MEPLEKIQPISSVVNQPHQFSYENGIYVTKVEPGRAEGVLEVGPDSINPHGMVHGGALATLADTVGGSCACATGRRCVTASSSMEFLRPAQRQAHHLHCHPEKGGTHPVGHPGGVVQRSGQTGGHRHIYLFHDGESAQINGNLGGKTGISLDIPPGAW